MLCVQGEGPANSCLYTKNARQAGGGSSWCSQLAPLRAWSRGEMGQKNRFLQKRTGEVVENKGQALQNGTKRTEKRSGEVIENKSRQEKRTGEYRKTKLAKLLKIQNRQKPTLRARCQTFVAFSASTFPGALRSPSSWTT